MADIGITYSSNPSRLLQQSGEFLSNNIRDIGRQVQSTILEINTRKDLARFAQNLQQNVNPNSDDFATQAVQVAANHPLAVQDPRGQIALNILGKAHGQWRDSQDLVARSGLTGNAPGIGVYDKRTGKVITPAPVRGIPIHGVGLTDPITGDVITPEGVRQTPDSYTSTPNGIMNRKTGLDPQGNPIELPRKGAMTDAQAAKIRLDSIKAQRDAATKMRDDLRQKLNANRAREAAFMKLDEPTRQQRIAELEEIHNERKQLNLMDAEAVGAINGYIQELETLGASDDLGLPPVSAEAAAPTDELVAVFNPQGQPKKIKRSQLEAALKNGYKQR